LAPWPAPGAKAASYPSLKKEEKNKGKGRLAPDAFVLAFANIRTNLTFALFFYVQS
jgi:hypothetical protein